MNMSQQTTNLLTIVAVTATLYTLLTRFEWGLLRVLPTKAHLGLDFLTGALLCAAPFFVLENASQKEQSTLLVLGLFEIGVALTTHTRSPLEQTQSQVVTNQRQAT
jgi:hypothetical protein